MSPKEGLELIEKLQDTYFLGYIFRGLYTKIGIIIVSIIVFGVSYSLTEILSLNKENYIFFLIIIIPSIIRIIYALFKRFYLPTNSKNKIGLVIAINDRGSFGGYKMLEDFINHMNKHLTQDFKIIVLPNRYTSQISKKMLGENKSELVLKLNKRLKCHYWIYGDVKKEKDGEERYFLETFGATFHRNINENVHNELTKDFSSVFAKEISFSEQYYRSGYKFCGEHNAIVAKYIIGVCQLISGNPFGAWELHKHLLKELETLEKKENIDANFNDQYVKFLAQKFKTIQIHEISLLCKYRYYKEEQKRVDFFNQWQSLATLYGIKNSELLTQTAIYEFLINKDLIQAKKYIKQSRTIGNKVGGDYSLVFLYLYEGNYKEAKRIMTLILKKNKNWEGETVREIIRFINNIIKLEETKFEFIYWKAVLLYKKLNDIPNSYLEIIKYKDLVGNQCFEYEVIKPNILLHQLNKELKISIK